MKEEDAEDKYFENSMANTMEDTNKYITNRNLITPQGYHGMFDNLDNYILKLKKYEYRHVITCCR